MKRGYIVALVAAFSIGAQSVQAEILSDLPNPASAGELPPLPLPLSPGSSPEKTITSSHPQRVSEARVVRGGPSAVFSTSAGTVPQAILLSDIKEICQTTSTWSAERTCYDTYTKILNDADLWFSKDICTSNSNESTAKCYRTSLSRQNKRISYGRNRFEDVTVATCGAFASAGSESVSKCYRTTLARLAVPSMTSLKNISEVCQKPSTWSVEKSCYETVLKSSRAHSEEQLARGIIQNSKASGGENAGKIARSVVEKMSSLHPFLSKATGLCTVSSTWSSETNCHDNLLFKAREFYVDSSSRTQIILESCAYHASSEPRAKCLAKAVDAFASSGSSYKAACDAMNTWSETENCLKNIVKRFTR